MKRDLDLCRQLLADIEGHGPDCAVTALRPGISGEAEETIRYHVRLLIDAGFVKEVDRPQNGVPCVRLTNSGHEMLELAHSENRWREAKWLVGERTGTQSLTVIRSVLARWATEAAYQGDRNYRSRRAYNYLPAYDRPYAYTRQPRTVYHRVEPRYRFERDLEPTLAEPRTTSTVARSPYRYLERFDWRDAAERDTFFRTEGYFHRDPLFRDPLYRDGYYRDAEAYDLDGVTLPTHVV